MSTPIRLVLNPREIYDLLGFLNDLPSLPPDLVDVPSKLRAALQSLGNPLDCVRSFLYSP